jgi:6-phosphogluconate dehydrogenase
MQIGVIGLGRMGSNISRRLMRAGHRCIVYDRNPDAMAEIGKEGAEPASELSDLVRRLEPPRTVWVMLPAGGPTESTITLLASSLSAGDVVIDGGNTYYQDDVRRAQSLALSKLHYLDVGTSGGIWGLERGYCLMIGGERAVFERVEPIFAALAPGGDAARPAPQRGYLYCGTHGAGHFVKMIHNGIEYGLMQAYAEGFDILNKANGAEIPQNRRYDFDLAAIAEVWRHGSVIESWLLDLTAAALREDAELDGFSGFVQDSGEGRWTIMAAMEEAVPVTVLSAALHARFRSREVHTFADKIVSAMRNKFGGHVEPKT